MTSHALSFLLHRHLSADHDIQRLSSDDPHMPCDPWQPLCARCLMLYEHWTFCIPFKIGTGLVGLPISAANTYSCREHQWHSVRQRFRQVCTQTNVGEWTSELASTRASSNKLLKIFHRSHFPVCGLLLAQDGFMISAYGLMISQGSTVRNPRPYGRNTV